MRSNREPTSPRVPKVLIVYLLVATLTIFQLSRERSDDQSDVGERPGFSEWNALLEVSERRSVLLYIHIMLMVEVCGYMKRRGEK